MRLRPGEPWAPLRELTSLPRPLYSWIWGKGWGSKGRVGRAEKGKGRRVQKILVMAMLAA